MVPPGSAVVPLGHNVCEFLNPQRIPRCAKAPLDVAVLVARLVGGKRWPRESRHARVHRGG
jgi:hypothetical protein